MAPHTAAAADEAELGFSRAEFGTESLAGTAEPPSLHLLCCYSSPEAWSPRLEESTILSNLGAAVKARKAELVAMYGSVKVTATEVNSEAGDTEGDVLVFLARGSFRRWRGAGLGPEAFVASLLLGDGEAGGTSVEDRPSVFVCAHAQRDGRCGRCGPQLLAALRSSAPGRLWVRGCAHIGGHKWAGNVVVMRPGKEHVWFGYVDLESVPSVIAFSEGRDAHPSGLLARGRSGLTKLQHKEECAGCIEGGVGDIEDLGGRESPANPRKQHAALAAPAAPAGLEGSGVPRWVLPSAVAVASVAVVAALLQRHSRA